MDYQGFQTTMSGGRGLPPDLVGTNVQPLPKIPDMPFETNDDVVIFDERDDGYQLDFSSLLGPEDDSQRDFFSLLEPEDEGKTDLFSLIAMLTDDTSDAMMSQTQPTSAPLDIHTVSIASNTATQQKPVTTSNSNVGHQTLMQPLFTNQNFQQAMPVHVGPGLVTSNTSTPEGPAHVQSGSQSQREPDMAGPQPQVAVAASTAGSSTGGKIKKQRKAKEYERTTPYDNEEQERRRRNAIKAKEYRNKKKQEGDDQRHEILRLEQVNSTLTQEIFLLNQKLMAANQVIERQNKEKMEEKKMLQQLLKPFALAMQKHNG